MARKLLIFALLFTFVSSSAFAQAQPGATDEAATKSSIGGPRRQLATILFAGLGGAILGLSTLSFYGRPQDKLANIAIGFAVGVIAGTAYVTYKAANNPRELYGYNYVPEFEKLSHVNPMKESSPLQASYSLSF